MTSQEIKDLAPSMPTAYLRAFFAEKDIPCTTFEVAGPSGPNYIPNVVVVEHIAQCSQREAKMVANILRRLDFANADINGYLRHLAGAIAR